MSPHASNMCANERFLDDGEQMARNKLKLERREGKGTERTEGMDGMEGTEGTEGNGGWGEGNVKIVHQPKKKIT